MPQVPGAPSCVSRPAVHRLSPEWAAAAANAADGLSISTWYGFSVVLMYVWNVALTDA